MRYGYLGLLPRWHKCGNTKPRYPEAVQQFVEKVINDVYAQDESPTVAAAYNHMRLVGDSIYPALPSRRLFGDIVKAQPTYILAMKRKGKRVAYQHAPRILKAGETNENHGNRPFEVVYVDHTLIDLQTVCGTTGINLGRLWISVMIDGYSRKILAFALSYDPPSYATTMLLMRDCVRNHSRAPDLLVVDGGKEFESIYFYQLMAHCGCDWKQRPPALSRFGSIIERMFGTLNTEFLYNLRGNTQIMKEVRQVTKSFNPENLATWNFSSLYAFLDTYFFRHYEVGDHPTLPMTRRDAFESGKNRAGSRPNRTIKYDSLFYTMTMPSTRTGKATVVSRLGVRVNYIYYWHDDMALSDVVGKKIEVRYDPYDRGVAFAYINGRWVVCRSEKYSVFSGMSDKQLRIASLELVKENQDRAKNRILYGTEIARLVQSAKGQEALQIQKLQDRARNSFIKPPAAMRRVPSPADTGKQTEASGSARCRSASSTAPESQRGNIELQCVSLE